MASKEEKAREPVKPYDSREGMVWKGGLNPDVSRITVRPDPPEPLGTTGGVSPGRCAGSAGSGISPVSEGSRRLATTRRTDPRRLQQRSRARCT